MSAYIGRFKDNDLSSEVESWPNCIYDINIEIQTKKILENNKGEERL